MPRVWPSSNILQKEGEVWQMRKWRPHHRQLHKRRTKVRELQRKPRSMASRMPCKRAGKSTTVCPQEGSMDILHRHIPMTHPSSTNNHSNFQILQNNLNHNSASTDSILSNPDSSPYTILLLQEQYCLRNTLSSPNHSSWMLIEPTVAAPLHPRVAIYINKRLLPTSMFEPVYLPFRDATAVAIKMASNKSCS